ALRGRREGDRRGGRVDRRRGRRVRRPVAPSRARVAVRRHLRPRRPGPRWVLGRRARRRRPPRRARARRAPGRRAPRAVRGRRRVPGRGGLTVATTQDTEQRKSSSNGGGGETKTMRYREALNE